MTALTMVTWPVFLVFVGGAVLGFLVGYLLGGWRASPGEAIEPAARSAAPGTRPTARASARPAARPTVWRVPAADGGVGRAGERVAGSDVRGAAASVRPPQARHDDADGPAILLVDDRIELLAMHAAYLRKHGYRTLLAETGTAALAFAREYHPAVIVLDHSMPGRTGVEVARELKRDPATADIPIVLMTAHSYGAVGPAAMAAGCSAFLSKPVEPSRLLREIEARTPRH